MPTPQRLTSRQIDRLTPTTGKLEDLVGNVSRLRQRPITLLPIDANPGEGITGLCVATPSADYIVFPVAAAPTHRDAIVCHELAHLLLGHADRTDTDALSQLAQIAAPTLDPSVATNILRRHEYATSDEWGAELLGTRFAAALVAASLAAASAPLARRLG